MSTVNQVRKAIGAAAVGLIGWATMVVESASDSITGTEWIALGTIAITVLAVFGISNEPAPE